MASWIGGTALAVALAGCHWVAPHSAEPVGDAPREVAAGDMQKGDVAPDVPPIPDVGATEAAETCGACSGCCAGPICVPDYEQTAQTCGLGGVSCQDCVGDQVCVGYGCQIEEGTCTVKMLPPRQPCVTQLGDHGKCDAAGNCCAYGCLGADGSCYAGTTIAACGLPGEDCTPCSDSPNECQPDYCISRQCTTLKKTDGIKCAAGASMCIGGVCCLGCISPTGDCIQTPSDDYCGPIGAPCDDCAAKGLTCDNGSCK